MRQRSEPPEERVPLRERLLDVPSDVPRTAWYGRIAALAVVALWGLSVVFGKMTDTPNMLHLTVILFHEAGHVIFTPFGEALRVAGGTLGQLLMPLICAVALHRRDDNFLFDRYGQLDHARGWARLMKAMGAIGLLASLAWGAVLLYLQSENLAGQ